MNTKHKPALVIGFMLINGQAHILQAKADDVITPFNSRVNNKVY